MKLPAKLAIILMGFWILSAGLARAQYSFELIDNFESGKADKWYKFGNLGLTVAANPSVEARDTVAEACEGFFLRIKGRTDNWYVGGIGTDLNIDATAFSRLQFDVYGGPAGGQIKVELFDDDNGNSMLEQDSSRDWLAVKDDKWVATVPVLGKGWTRVSIPFSAFRLENPGCGDGIWNPDHNNNSGGLLKIQMILLTEKQTGEVEAGIDNVLLTY